MGLLSRFTQKQETSDTQDSGEFRSRAEEESIETRSRTKKAEPRRRSKVNDPILPEKKRARRRLIGAVALALAAIIGLPMILDSDPKPLADDISIRIPSKDKVGDADVVVPKAKNPLSPEPPEEIIEVPSLPKNKVAGNENTDRQIKTATAATNAATAQPAAQVKPEIKTETKSLAKVDTKPEPKVEVKPLQTPPKPVEKEAATAKSEVKGDVKPVKSEVKPVVAKPGNADDEAARALAILEGKAPPVAKPVVSKLEAAEKSVEKSSYTVQAGAFSTQAKVDEVQAKLNAANIHSYTQKIITTNGEVIRVRVGPFASKEEADKMRAKLSKLGLSASLPPN
ncbi:SPOR domain-containing protein [Undibacterium sp.]|uniref:SPOR domain-containing protein n=1 Tax=Undibacterium sp. TaxID=1914977 RepID=UPI0027315D82|nr:SPOR domain-containing protein [Undibacterium sp.]MDP1977107.1 SPOR domain-containing protein [Undibacterium sp.]